MRQFIFHMVDIGDPWEGWKDGGMREGWTFGAMSIEDHGRKVRGPRSLQVSKHLNGVAHDISGR